MSSLNRILDKINISAALISGVLIALTASVPCRTFSRRRRPSRKAGRGKEPLCRVFWTGLCPSAE